MESSQSAQKVLTALLLALHEQIKIIERELDDKMEVDGPSEQVSSYKTIQISVHLYFR